MSDLTAMLKGREELGLMTGHRWQTDPQGLLFTLARYKFVARMLAGQNLVLEVGCGDAFPSRIVRQHVGTLVCVDKDERLIADARDREKPTWPTEYRVHDILKGPVYLTSWAYFGGFGAAYALDVLEHIAPSDEDAFLGNLSDSVYECAIVGMPSIESQAYASELSRLGHVNCKTGADLKAAMRRHFRGTILFGMNDETLHTGFPQMAHYLICLGWK